MHKKDILFLISLPDDIKAGMKISYTQYISILRSIERIELRESISQNDLAIADQFPLVVIVGHNNGPEESLILENGTLLPWASIISYLPVSCANTIDIGACKARLGEKSVAEAIKDHCPSIRRVLSPKKATKVEGRLMLYREMLPSIDLDKDYYEVYCSKVAELKQRIIRLKEGRKSQTETLKGTNLGTMSTSAAPETVYRNSPFPVKVYIHADGDEIDINVEIEQYQKHRKRKLKLNDGDQVKWDLSFNTDPKPEYAQYLEHIKGERSYFDTWNSDELEIRRTFNFFVEEAFPLNGFNGVLKTIIGENKLDEWSFTVTVLPYKDDICIKQEQIEGDKNDEYDFVKNLPRDIKVDSDSVSLAYGYMTLLQLSGHVEGKISKVNEKKYKTITVIGRIKEDYNDIKDEIQEIIDKRKKTDSLLNGDRLDNLKERLYIIDNRLLILDELIEIKNLYDKLTNTKIIDDDFSREKRKDICDHAFNFFEIITNDFYNSFLKRIYGDWKGESPFINNRKDKDDELRREFNGLAIMLANPRISLDVLHRFLFYKKAETITENKPILPSVEEIFNKNRRDVNDKIVGYIDKIINDNSLKKELDDYLAMKEGYSSVIAYYLREICKSKGK